MRDCDSQQTKIQVTLLRGSHVFIRIIKIQPIKIYIFYIVKKIRFFTITAVLAALFSVPEVLYLCAADLQNKATFCL